LILARIPNRSLGNAKQAIALIRVKNIATVKFIGNHPHWKVRWSLFCVANISLSRD